MMDEKKTIDEFKTYELMRELAWRLSQGEYNKHLYEIYPELKYKIYLSHHDTQIVGETCRLTFPMMHFDFHHTGIRSGDEDALRVELPKSLDRMGEKLFKISMDLLHASHPTHNMECCGDIFSLTNWVPEDIILIHPKTFMKYQQLIGQANWYKVPPV